MAPTPLLLLIRLFEREPNAIDIGDVVNGIGPPTSIGGDSAFGLSPEFCDVLFNKLKEKSIKRLKIIIQSQWNLKLFSWIVYLKPGDGEPALPEHDCDIVWWLWCCVDDDLGLSKSESEWAGALELKCSSSLSPTISGDDSRLASFFIKEK